MRSPIPRRLLQVLAVTTAVAAAAATFGVAHAATRHEPATPAMLQRPASDQQGQLGALAPIGAEVVGLTGTAAQQLAGPAADQFRRYAADRSRQLTPRAVGGQSAPKSGSTGSGGAVSGGQPRPLAAAELHTAWGTLFEQPNGKGIQATHSVLTGTAAVTHNPDVVYAPTVLSPGGACMEMTTAYTAQGPLLWAWDWCGGNAGIGKVVTINASFLTTYTTTVNGQPAYSTDVHQTNAANNTWAAYLYNYQTHAWDTFYTSSGTYDLADKGFGWDIFEIYSTVNPATNTAWYCTSMAGKKFEASSIKVNINGTWAAATPANTYPMGTPPPGSDFECPALAFSVVHANDDWVAQIGGGTTTPPPAGTNLARSATASASYTSPWESVAAVNDGAEPARSNDTVNPRWGTWPNRGEQSATLTWTQTQHLTSAEVYFFDDNGGVRLPTSWRLQYYNGSSYVDVPGASGYPTAINAYNRVTFTAVDTTRLRVVLQSGNGSVGLLELRAYGG